MVIVSSLIPVDTKYVDFMEICLPVHRRKYFVVFLNWDMTQSRSIMMSITSFEPEHDKSKTMACTPIETQISLRIRVV